MSAPAVPAFTTAHPHVSPPAPAARIVRYRGGTYSSTIHRIAFADGSTARTDLVRLNPGIRAYSLAFDGKVSATPVAYSMGGPTPPPTRARFRWPAIADIVAASYPAVDLGTLSHRLRAAGYPLDVANLRDDEAIAATQAAIWRLTDNRLLDTARRNRPSRLRATVGPDVVPARLRRDGITVDATIDATHPLTIDVEFDRCPVLAGLTFAASTTELTITLHKQTAAGWVPVSRRSAADQMLRVPPLATVARSHHGVEQGYHAYRVTVTSSSIAAVPVTLSRLQFEISGQSVYSNTANVVHLYNYLCGLPAQASPTHDAVVLVAEAPADRDAGLTPLVCAVPRREARAKDSLTVRPIAMAARRRTSGHPATSHPVGALVPSI